MSRIWINYELWEDHKNGMYSKNKQDEQVKLSVVNMFKKQAVFFELAMQMVSLWPYSADHNLSYFKSNRQSYLGQATACFRFDSNIRTTTEAWNELTLDEMKKANFIADLVLEYYDQEIYPKKHKEALDENLS